MSGNKGKKKTALDMSSAIEPVREVKGKEFTYFIFKFKFYLHSIYF